MPLTEVHSYSTLNVVLHSKYATFQLFSETAALVVVQFASQTFHAHFLDKWEGGLYARLLFVKGITRIISFLLPLSQIVHRSRLCLTTRHNSQTSSAWNGGTWSRSIGRWPTVCLWPGTVASHLFLNLEVFK